ncbi:MAG: DUF1653 domain-containing protein [Bacteroidales bacterium]|nr:DUF1653 domain-containing protein [Lachnoclostridium sp.]MCM1383645.1 DUF1653 domain-containing protein [Lachnoclostridium sp.]MCM1465726.1 DUF1653 domain-containing protein [Bacteroidales bacterium]
MSFIPRPHEIYKHFKGNLYQIVAIAKHSETGEQLVIYRALYDDLEVYARPLEMFISKVDKVKYPDAAQKFRFELQGVDADRQHEAEEEQDKEDKQQSGESTGAKPDVETDSAESQLDPMVLEFLEADSYEERLNILAGLRHRITDDMITTMAIACDVEVEEGSTQERYDSLRNCLLTLDKYECSRLR